MSSVDLTLVSSVFLASLVEAVEALTVVLAVGSTRSWRSALIGAAGALLALACLIGLLGGALTTIPVATLRLIVGAFLLLFGLQWLRKAILRSAGQLAMHEEDLAFSQESAAALSAGDLAPGLDRYSTTVAFKAVLLEGVEVALIVITFGSAHSQIGLAALAAAVAVLLVAFAGWRLRAPLTRVPENTLKSVVGVLLTAFGIFWSTEGAGASWPGGDRALPVLIVLVAGLALALGAHLRRTEARHRAHEPGRSWRSPLGNILELLLGDDPQAALGVVAGLLLTAALADSGPAWLCMPLATPLLLWHSLATRTR